jgi:carboxyl-terminal processing protease
MNRKGPAAAAICALLVAACGGGGGDDDDAGPGAACGVEAEKTLVFDTTNDRYLFLELLPPGIAPAQFGTADALLDAMTATARAQAKDRFFSHLASIAAEQQFFAGGESVGFGVSTKTNVPAPGARPTRVFIAQVFTPSPAASAGFARGDEILQLGESAATLVDVATLLATDTGFSNALGPAQSGVTRVFRVQPVGGGAAVNRTVAKGTFSLEPLPQPIIIPRNGLTPVGYLNFRTFVSPADNLLRNAFAEFRAQNVRDIIVDLRYNGGGLVSTAEIFASLLAQQAASANRLMHRTEFNSRRAPIDVRFRVEAQAIEPVRVAFLTTGSSASASELLINSLTPHAETAVIGERSFGKPVGQEAFDLAGGCDTRLRLVTFKSVNSAGYGDYFTGLHPDAGFADTFCDAADELASPQGDVAEDMTGTALHWINNGVCPPTVAPKLGTRVPEKLTDMPLPRRPSPEQVYQPGFM